MHNPGPAFRALHRRGAPFVLANAWDIGSARLLAGLGAQAIGTSSAALAFTLGLPDGSLTRDQMLAHAEMLVAATPLPVSGDFQNGYGADPDTVAETVRLACDAGLAGISIEDSDLPGAGSYSRELAAERIRAATDAARSLPRDFFLVARADGVMLGNYDMEEGLARLKAFEGAGADGLYLPAPPSFEDLQRVAQSTELPVNALAAGPFASYAMEDFARIGIARISLGSALARAVQRTMIDTMNEITEDGSFSKLKKSVSEEDVIRLLLAGTATD